MEALSRLALLAALCSAGAPQETPPEGAPPSAPSAGDAAGPEAAWQRAATLDAADPARASAVAEALGATPDDALSDARVRLAWETGVAAARALRLDDAIAIQRVLEARRRAPWSAMDLALSLGLAGRTDEADAVLARAIERAGDDPSAAGELWSRRGLLWLGAGDERRARDDLGRALVQGSRDAALLLARLDLDAGRLADARAGFRSLLDDQPPGAWALRGWGLSLLPPLAPRNAAHAPHATPRAPANPEETDR